MARALLRVTGTTCPSCEGTIEAFLRRERGVQRVKVSHKSGTAEVDYDESMTSPDNIASASIFRGAFSAEVIQ